MAWRLNFNVGVLLLIGAACGPSDPPSQEPAEKYIPKKPSKLVVPVLSAAEKERQKKLAQQVCGICHVWPEPGVLNRKAWVDVLDLMEPWLGLKPIPESVPDELHGLFPAEKLVDAVQWTELKKYYLTNAPEELQVPHVKFHGDLKLFEVVDAKAPFSPFCMTVRVEPKTGAIWAGWGVFPGEHGVFRRQASGVWSEKMDWGGTPSQFRFTSTGILSVMIGSYFPSDEAEGELVKAVQNKPVRLMGSLKRPTDVLIGNFDGKEPADMVLCEFGNLAGGVSFIKDMDQAKRQPLLDQPGILNAASADFNGDGHLDFAVVAGQAREGVYLFLGDGQGKFETRAILPRHPSWGHSHLEVADINGDGHPDLLITNGDNGDIKGAPFKPYHGIRIHLNDGKGNFKGEKFFAQPGAYRALARDFDDDGDLDIASIAYADFKSNPALIFLWQHKPMEFLRLKMPGAIKDRWITMDAGDVDLDGDVDLVLGVMDSGPSPKTILIKTRRLFEQEKTPVLILRNRLR